MNAAKCVLTLTVGLMLLLPFSVASAHVDLCSEQGPFRLQERAGPPRADNRLGAPATMASRLTAINMLALTSRTIDADFLQRYTGISSQSAAAAVKANAANEQLTRARWKSFKRVKDKNNGRGKGSKKKKKKMKASPGKTKKKK